MSIKTLLYYTLISLAISIDDVKFMNTLNRYLKAVENFTSCEEFINGSTFDAKDVIDVDWKIFYIWNSEYLPSYQIRFSFPEPSLIKRYQASIQPDLNKTTNWASAYLFMETSVDMSALFMKTDTTGIYSILPNQIFNNPELKLPLFALKVVEPGYLGVYNCKYRDGFALAPVDKMPDDKNLTIEAMKLVPNNAFGYSYLMNITEDDALVSYDPPNRVEDDADDDVQELIDAEQKLNLF